MSVVKNLIKNFGDFSINIKNWEIADSGLTVIWGSSGAGKTSAMKALLGLEEYDALEWWFAGENIFQMDAIGRNIGAVFQEPSLFPHLTVRENILFPLHARGKKCSEKQLVEHASFFTVESLLDRKARFLSGGEQQKTALARALMTQPRILLLDEPFSSMDLQFKVQARHLVKKVSQEWSIPILLVSHDPKDIEQLAQRVVIFDRGEIKASQMPQEFLQQLKDH